MTNRKEQSARVLLSHLLTVTAIALALSGCGGSHGVVGPIQSGDPTPSPVASATPTVVPTPPVDITPDQAFSGYWGSRTVTYSDSTPSSGGCTNLSFDIQFGADTVTISQRDYHCGSTSITASSITLAISAGNLFYEGASVGTIGTSRLSYQVPAAQSGLVGHAGLDFDLGADRISESGSASGSGIFYSYSVNAVPVKLAPLSPLVVRALGNDTCAVAGNIVKCWGDNQQGELGSGSSALYSSLAVPVGTSTTASLVQAGTAKGDNHTCTIVNGGLFCWGDNSSGQLGNGSTTSSSTPIQVQGLTSGVTAVAVGSAHTCAVVNGAIECWGSSSYGQIGTRVGNPSPLIPGQVQGLSSGATAITAGLRHTCAIVNGGVQCWGDNSTGEVGNNSSANIVSVPSPVQGLASGVSEIAAGDWHSCAIVNGSAWCWGDDTFGQLGNAIATMNPFRTPIQVQGLTGAVSSIAAGAVHSCAIVNGMGSCWGNNAFGQLGDYSTSDAHLPRIVLFQP